MKNLLLASVAVLALGAPAFAQDTLVGPAPTTDAEAGAVVGSGAGGATGAVVGGLLGGPIGAVIGGFAGATLGAEAGVAASTTDFAAANPVEPIYLDSDLDVGYTVPADVTIYPVQGDDRYGYFYANDRVWIVDLETRALVQSPGYLVSSDAAAYATSNPVASSSVSGDVVVGYVLPDDVELTAIPDSRSYSYIYINDRPVLVENRSRAVISIN